VDLKNERLSKKKSSRLAGIFGANQNKKGGSRPAAPAYQLVFILSGLHLLEHNP